MQSLKLTVFLVSGARNKHCGFLTSSGSPISHAPLINALLDAILLPKQISVMHCKAHTGGSDDVSQGNACADKHTQHAALDGTPLASPFCLVLDLSTSNISLLQDAAPESEKHAWLSAGCILHSDTLWKSPDGSIIAPKTLVPHLARASHEMGHVCKRGVAENILRYWYAPTIHAVAKRISQTCAICLQHGISKPTYVQASATPWSYGPFQNLQVDFIDLLPSKGFKHVLVIVCHFSGWTEAYPTRRADAVSVAKELMTELIPQFGIPLTLDSDQGPHFTSQIQKVLSKALGFSWKFHTPYHPASSGKVERINQDIKSKLPKLCKQTGLSWPDILLIVLMHLRNMPNRKHGLTPYEILFGRPMNVGLNPIIEIKAVDLLEGHESVLSYCKGLMKTFKALFPQVSAALPIPTDVPCHALRPGEWVLVKEFCRKDCLQPILP
ncbi:uncharacterized protein LOC132244771 [Alligator mississippiensis]|uniref:uncharacterized protein LOC132244771 n=1 Tax=Alligator mississippiensis TaxID=8496 RepID=UPI0028778169|nr:uncharacterized protein LOC132244771 [Alligator mississippiensis]XP_059573184.1 uncharacterized protein LOC132244771 [Alligator mississippiensis]XP_059573185.1 uncharacterized protein LOC132244771 [Alligator mississippiensis]XP_059573186.1 uncharacterized protein LOC132244771 [Alligator mississippiensis]XP_059573187.1 uncharacterized protein LOC132244771 [Alligator mississippiensis]XP_059573188.1 uncharacterized protein LOC132244771 [Alligator mississippiensis]